MPFHGAHCGFLTSYVFSLRSGQRAGLHKSDDRFCWFSFQGIRIDGGFCRSGLSTKPLAAQTLDAQADNMRLCTPSRCKKCPRLASNILVFLRLGVKISEIVRRRPWCAECGLICLFLRILYASRVQEIPEVSDK